MLIPFFFSWLINFGILIFIKIWEINWVVISSDRNLGYLIYFKISANAYIFANIRLGYHSYLQRWRFNSLPYVIKKKPLFTI